MISYPFEVHHCAIGNNISLAYCDEGKGPKTLVFIHGLGNYLPVFKHTINGLKDHYRCIAIDLPGNGLSSGGELPYTMAFYAECVSRLLQQIHPEPVVMVGHSMGGHVAMMVALRYKERVNRLVLLAPSGIEFYSEMERVLMKGALNLGGMLYGDEHGLRAAIENSYYHERRKDAAQIIQELVELMGGERRKYWHSMIKRNIESMLDDNLFRFLPDIAVPTLLIFGIQDAFVPNKFIHPTETQKTLAQKAAALMPDCRYELLHHCGHFVQIEHAHEVNHLVDEFLKEA